MVFDEFSILRRIVESMDTINVDGLDYVVQFGFGSHTELLSWLNQKRKEGTVIYPLIWVETPITLEGNPFAEADLKIIVATLTTKDLSNKERMVVTFEDALIPVSNDFISKMKLDPSIVNFDEEYFSFTKHFNYNTDSETESSDIWDAIRLELTLSFNLNCI